MIIPKRSIFSEILWWTFFSLILMAAAYLCSICLFTQNGVLAQSLSNQNSSIKETEKASSAAPTMQSPSQEGTSNSFPAQNPVVSMQLKVAELDSRTSEMSKRIEEVGNHATRVLSIIGLLIGFMSAVVAIGLWQSKQYMDRVVEHYKTEMKSFIKEETEKQLNEMKSTMLSQFQETMNKTIEELNSRGTTILSDLKSYQAEASGNLQTLSENCIDSNLRLSLLMLERFPSIFNKMIDTARERGVLTTDEQAVSKEEINFAVYTQQEVLKALVQLESTNVAEVMAGCHTISALRDLACLPALKIALSKWSKKENQRVVDQISAAYERLMSDQDENGANPANQ